MTVLSVHGAAPAGSSIGYHIVCALTDRRVIAPTVEARRLAARVIHHIGRGRRSLAFGLADTHAHFVVGGDRRNAGRFAHDVEVSLRFRLSLPVCFEPAHIGPIVDQRHLANVVRYALRQRPHHGLDDDPFCDASNLSDLLGMRVLGDDLHLRRLLPRLRGGALWELLEWARGPAPEVDDVALGTHLAEASAASVGLPDLKSRAADAARLAAVHVGAARLSARLISDRLQIDARSVRRLRDRAPNEAIVRAVVRQIRARTWFANASVLPEDDMFRGLGADMPSGSSR